MSKIAESLNQIKFELAEIKTRAEKATDAAGYNHTGLAFECKGKNGEAYFHIEMPTPEDAEFSYHAKADVMRLCDIMLAVLSDELLMRIAAK